MSQEQMNQIYSIYSEWLCNKYLKFADIGLCKMFDAIYILNGIDLTRLFNDTKFVNEVDSVARQVTCCIPLVHLAAYSFIFCW